MTRTTNDPFWQTVAVGSLAGSRTSAGPAIASSLISNASGDFPKTNISNFIQRKPVARALKLASIPELIIDKLPKTGNRIAPFGLIPRIISGHFQEVRCTIVKGTIILKE